MTATLDEESQLLLARCLYLAMPVVLLLWAIAGVRRLFAAQTPMPEFARRHAAGLAVALLVTIAAPLVSEPQMRMQFDETSLCGTAQIMHLERTALMGVAAVPGSDGLEITDRNLDKRPPLFSFLVSAVHDLTGYRIANAFVVNLVVLFLLLATLAVVARNRAGTWGGVAAPLLVGCVPLALVAGTSAGFELLATLLLAWVVLAAIDYSAEPSAVRGQWLLGCGLLFCQARYESLFVFALVLGLVFWRHRNLRVGRFGVGLLAVAPVLMAPIFALLWHSRDPGFYPEAMGRDLVALGNATTNVGPFFAAMFDPGLWHPFPGALAIVSVAVFGMWIGRCRAGFADILVVAPVLATTVVVWLWFYGDVREPTARRLYLPFAVLGALGPLTLLAMFRTRAFGLTIVVLAVALAVTRSLGLASGDVMPKHRVARLLEHIDGVVGHFPPPVHGQLWITTVAQYFVVHRRPAMTPARFATLRNFDSAVQVMVLTTPLDALLGSALGNPADVLARHTAIQRGTATDPDSAAEIVVYRLQR